MTEPQKFGTTLLAFHRRTFLKVGAFVLAAGVLAHILRLTVGLPVTQTPDFIHVLLVVLPSYAVFGCIVYWRQIDFPGVFPKTVFALIIGLFLVTAIMHAYSIVANTSAWLGIFPMWYSVLAAFLYGSFAYFLKTRTLVDS